VTRTPLRPLARILEARAKGENPDAIESENLRLRHEAMRDRDRMRAEGRLLVVGVFFFCAFLLVGGRMGILASAEVEEPRAAVAGASIIAQRADITDRSGRILATNLTTHALYAQPPQMVDPARAARELARIFPDLHEARLLEQFTGERKFLWIKRRISPEQKQAVHDIGDPGLLFGPREMRLYPNGRLASHVLGGASFGREGVHAAEVVGVAGVEKTFDAFLRDPGNDGQPLELSLDLSVQAVVEQVLAGGMRLMNARGATAILMDVHTGEIISMASLPDFDPNERPPLPTSGDPADSPLFNRAVQGVYELGSTFKIFPVAQALELGLISPSTVVDTRSPLRWGRFRITDFRYYGPEMTIEEVMSKSSNIGTVRVTQMMGVQKQQDFLGRLGFLEPTPVELVEAPFARPLLPRNWSEISMITISYGHGLSASPLHLAAAYATITNGGIRVTPTLVKRRGVAPGEQVISPRVSAQVRDMLRKTVTEGTASFGDVPGYEVGGKTGTADKPRRTGGYYDDKVITTFASVFPSSAPKYVLVVTLDEPVETSGTEPRRTAGWTAVPVAAEIIRRVAPLMGLPPSIEQGELVGVSLRTN
jgi:cell division protein FtsI (penicillin-binding protein 3)